MEALRFRMGSTTFVVGAGASREADMPLGADLRGQIASTLDIRYEYGIRQVSGSAEVDAAFRIAAAAEDPPQRSINHYLEACWRIRDAMPQAISIDNFVDSHAHDSRLVLAAKLAIVQSILRAEARSKLFLERQTARAKLDFSKLEGTWFGALWQWLTENCSAADLPKRLSTVSLIVFNYDRCVEQFMFEATKNYFAMSDSEAAAALAQLEVFHPYGTVGRLPWQGGNDTIEFGGTPSVRGFLSLARQIRTFSEGTDSSATNIDALRERAATAERLIFMGFAFHRLNVDLLFPEPITLNAPVPRSLYATAMNMSESNTDHVAAMLSPRCAIPASGIHIRRDLTCASLIHEYWWSLRHH
jgi:hypothetical protein